MTHSERIQRAVDFIEEHLLEEMTVGEIARQAAFSLWHFQRVFESQESFSRAFRKMFGITPGACRRRCIQSMLVLSRPRVTQEYLDHIYQGKTMEPVIRTIEQKRLVGMGTTFISILSDDKDNMVVIPKLWQAFNARRGEISQSVGDEYFGICDEIPAGTERTHEAELFYMAAVEVAPGAPVPSGMIERTIPAGLYARFTHKGPLDAFEQTMRFIYGSWLPSSGYERAPAPDLEVYDRRFKLGDEASEVDVCIPIRASGSIPSAPEA